MYSSKLKSIYIQRKFLRRKFWNLVALYGITNAVRRTLIFFQANFTKRDAQPETENAPSILATKPLLVINQPELFHYCSQNFAVSEYYESDNSTFKSEHSISVLVATIGRCETFKITLNSVLNSLELTQIEFEILVSIDSHTNESNKDWIIEQINSLRSSKISVVFDREYHGFGQQINALSKSAQYNLLFIMNDDVICEIDLFVELLKSDKISNHTILSPVILNPDRTIQEAGSALYPNGRTEWIGTGHDISWLALIKELKVDFASACTWLIYRDTFVNLGGFVGFANEMYYEDVRFACDPKHELNTYVITKARAIHTLSVSNSSSYKRIIVDRIVEPLFKSWWEEKRQQSVKDNLKLLAFYLPQFYETDYNNEWWGTGYTEWTAVARSEKFIIEQSSKLIPSELGFYNLTNHGILERQSSIARHYGIDAFVVMTYWFNGRRLLEKPLDNFLTSSIEVDFLLYWANESWTRRWDGQSDEILLKQEHSVEDSKSFIRAHKKFFEHPKYFKHEGKPVLFVYRKQLFGDIELNLEAMRMEAQDIGLGDLYICILESFDDSLVREDPTKYGFDAAVEYPPHGSFPFEDFTNRENQVFNGRVHDYRKLMSYYLCRPASTYPVIRGVAVGFDNTPRLMNKSAVFINNSPENFSKWIRGAIHNARSSSSFAPNWVVINAWNEWGESAVLEPNTMDGRQNLETIKIAKDLYQEKNVDIRHE